MINHRLIKTSHEPKEFIETAVQFLHKHVKDKKVFCALSGGIDSALTYLLLKKAKVNVIAVFIDHGLMRMIRGTEEREHIKALFPDCKIIDIRNEFLKKIFGEEDAEKKRKLFKAAYSNTINRVIKMESCDLLADGTILPDIEESFGVKIGDLKESMTLQEELGLKNENIGWFVKSQHNVEIEYDIEATVQPVASLTKPEVRKILEFLNQPDELVYRKAFPGPALAARIIGPVSAENLEFEKKVHDIVESMVNDYYKKKHGKSMIINDKGKQEPFQAFAAISEDILNKKVTGMINGKRTYESPLSVTCKWNFKKLTEMASKLTGYARIFYKIANNETGIYDVVIRSINSIDARTAEVTELPFDLITSISNEILSIPKSKRVYFDFTPKPPGTIEYV
ncbi:MAG: GMP synthase (glutamine-hydrolyzing) [Promethearchaeota archaeon]